jgi:hypothetical protein
MSRLQKLSHVDSAEGECSLMHNWTTTEEMISLKEKDIFLGVLNQVRADRK